MTATIENLYAEAAAKLNSLNIPLEFLGDESGQTSTKEHLTWLVNATETEIRQWLADMEESNA